MTEEAVNRERRWWTYLKAALFLVPPVGALVHAPDILRSEVEADLR